MTDPKATELEETMSTLELERRQLEKRIKSATGTQKERLEKTLATVRKRWKGAQLAMLELQGKLSPSQAIELAELRVGEAIGATVHWRNVAKSTETRKAAAHVALTTARLAAAEAVKAAGYLVEPSTMDDDAMEIYSLACAKADDECGVNSAAERHSAFERELIEARAMVGTSQKAVDAARRKVEEVKQAAVEAEEAARQAAIALEETQQASARRLPELRLQLQAAEDALRMAEGVAADELKASGYEISDDETDPEARELHQIAVTEARERSGAIDLTRLVGKLRAEVDAANKARKVTRIDKGHRKVA